MQGALSHFADGETEFPKVFVTCLKWHTWKVAGSAFNPPVTLDSGSVLLCRYPHPLSQL